MTAVTIRTANFNVKKSPIYQSVQSALRTATFKYIGKWVCTSNTIFIEVY